MKKIAVYTVLTGNYDKLNPVRVKSPGIDHICFTDDGSLHVEGWRMKRLQKSQDPCKQQRNIKILPHKYLENYDITIYIDANMEIIQDFNVLLRKYTGGLLITKHDKRDCVYKEGLEIIRQKKADKEKVNEQIAEYYSRGIEPCSGMYASGLMIRDNSPEIVKMCEMWVDELNRFTHRDQLSLPVALQHFNIKPTLIDVRGLYSMVRRHPHRSQEPIKVFYSTPYRSNKDIGGANNEFISLLPEDAWVCITDADAMFLQPDFGTHIENIIRENGNRFGLIGCLTNRLGGLHQCYKGEFSDNLNARDHFHIAHELREIYGNQVEETSGVSGLCMIFSKQTWKQAGGFIENIITADTEFNNSVRNAGKKIGLAKGLYMFHAYRILQKERLDAQKSIEHLKVDGIAQTLKNQHQWQRN